MITQLRIRKADPRLALQMRGPLGDLVRLAEQGEAARIVAVIGPPGPAGAGAPLVHVQAAPLASWTINHNRGWRPASVTVLSPGGVEVDAEIVHVSVNQTVINFALPYAGSALIN